MFEINIIEYRPRIVEHEPDPDDPVAIGLQITRFSRRVDALDTEAMIGAISREVARKPRKRRRDAGKSKDNGAQQTLPGTEAK